METSTISTSRFEPARKRATVTGLPTVADSPILWNSPATSTSRSSAMDSWAPRLLAASSCTSSTTTYCTDPRFLRNRLPVSMICRVSGVVISTSGGCLLCFCRWYLEVSPCRTWTSISSWAPITASLASISRFSARSGVMYSADIPLRPSSFLLRMWWNTGSMALSVLPLPVGAMSSRLSPFSSFGIVRTCGSVGWVKPIDERTAWRRG